MQIDPKLAERAKLVPDANTIATAFDASRLAGLQLAQAIAEAKANTLRLEHARLADKYGTNSQQATLVASRASLQSVLVTRANAMLERAAIPPITVVPGTAVVFGRVVDDIGAGLAGYTVSAVSVSGAALGHSTSESGGAFRIVMQVSGAGRGGLLQTGERADHSAAIASSSGAATQPVVVHLEVAMGSSVVVRSDESLSLGHEEAAYREVIVSAGRSSGDEAKGITATRLGDQ